MLGYFVTIFAGMFWLFRVIVALMYSTETSFPIVPINMIFEIILLFITFICIVLIAKRKMLGAILYLIAQCAYFGVDAYKAISAISGGQTETANYLTLFISIIAVIIPVIALMDIGLNTGKKGSVLLRDKKTDWFYGTTEYDRNMDDRADKNQYKF